MEPYTLDRSFHKVSVIDEFESVIWTERYYGDSEVELVVPATTEMIQKLTLGRFLGLDNSDEIMILETMNIEDGKLKITGISLLKWLDNRFIRSTNKHEDRYWPLDNLTAGAMMWVVLYNMCCQGSPYLSGSINIGLTNPQSLIIPGLTLLAYDDTGPKISVAVPYGPVYTTIRDNIAVTYEIGMKISLVSVTDTSYVLGYRNYKGLDYTSGQSVNPVVRFSPQMDSFTDIKDVQSIAALKTLVYAFAPGLKPDEGQPPLTTVPGVKSRTDSSYTGFDLRAQQIFADDITTDMVGGSQAKVVELLNSRALDELTKDHYIKSVDGQIVPENQFQYGINYHLGDIIEVEGNTGVVQSARITEYIRAQDSSGEKAYPTVSMIG